MDIQNTPIIYEYNLLLLEAKGAGMQIPLANFIYSELEFATFGISLSGDEEAATWIKDLHKEALSRGNKFTFFSIKRLGANNTLTQFIDGEWETTIH